MPASFTWDQLLDTHVPLIDDEAAVGARHVRIRATDDLLLAATVFEPCDPSGRVVVINSATAVPRGFYTPFARALATRGYTVVTWDYRGTGGSRPASLRGFEATMADWGERDFAGVLAWVRATLGDPRPTVIGHSVGGQLPGLTDAGELGAVVLVASQLGSWHHWPVPQRYLLRGLWYGAMPLVADTFGYLPGAAGIGEDIPAGVARQWAEWGRDPDHFLGQHPERRARLAAHRCAVLSLSFSDDLYAPRSGVDALADAWEGARVTRRHLRPSDVGASEIGHFAFFRPRFEHTLWQQLFGWLDSLVPGVHVVN